MKPLTTMEERETSGSKAYLQAAGETEQRDDPTKAGY